MKSLRKPAACASLLLGSLILLVGCAPERGLPPIVDLTRDAGAGVAARGVESAPAGALPAEQVDAAASVHVVAAGDTLYGIAWKYSLDYRTIADLNGIRPPYQIVVGQQLRLRAPAAGSESGGDGAVGVMVAAGAALPPADIPGGAALPPGQTVLGDPAVPPVIPAEPNQRGFEYVMESGPDPQDAWRDVPPIGQGGADAGTASGTLSAGASVPGSVLGGADPRYPGTVASTTAATSAPDGRAASSVTSPGVGPAPAPGGLQAGAVAPAPETSVAATPAPVAPAPSVPAAATTAPAAMTAPAATMAPVTCTGKWGWPTGSKIDKGFAGGNRGIDFTLDAGSPVTSVGAGEVVYAGNGLGDYRHLVIVKHDPRYLSAYSLNRPITVAEGDRIGCGGIIARAGSGSGSAADILRFEIRRDGQPIDPIGVIGKRR